jgi:hypothetical protein
MSSLSTPALILYAAFGQADDSRALISVKFHCTAAKGLSRLEIDLAQCAKNRA